MRKRGFTHLFAGAALAPIIFCRVVDSDAIRGTERLGAIICRILLRSKLRSERRWLAEILCDPVLYFRQRTFGREWLTLVGGSGRLRCRSIIGGQQLVRRMKKLRW